MSQASSSSSQSPSITYSPYDSDSSQSTSSSSLPIQIWSSEFYPFFFSLLFFFSLQLFALSVDFATSSTEIHDQSPAKSTSYSLSYSSLSYSRTSSSQSIYFPFWSFPSRDMSPGSHSNTLEVQSGSLSISLSINYSFSSLGNFDKCLTDSNFFMWLSARLRYTSYLYFVNLGIYQSVRRLMERSRCQRRGRSGKQSRVVSYESEMVNQWSLVHFSRADLAFALRLVIFSSLMSIMFVSQPPSFRMRFSTVPSRLSFSYFFFVSWVLIAILKEGFLWVFKGQIYRSILLESEFFKRQHCCLLQKWRLSGTIAGHTICLFYKVPLVVFIYFGLKWVLMFFDGFVKYKINLVIQTHRYKMHQQKRMHPQTKYLPEGRSPKQNKKQGKIKQIKSKIFRNLNQFPIQLEKDNFHPRDIQPHRPASALNSEQPYVRTKARVESALSQYHNDNRDKPNRKRLSLDSTGKRFERQSLHSRNSMSRKPSRGYKADEVVRVKLAEQRKKSNISCVSACEEGQKVSKKQSVKIKRQSFSNLQVVKGREKMGKENRSPKNNINKEKSRSRSKPKRKVTGLDKSKASTTAINTHEKNFVKKKQSTSALHLNGKKKKKPRKKSPVRPEIDDSIDYPINKYDIGYSTHHQTRLGGNNTKTRSKSRKGSSGKQPKRSSLYEIDYASCINIPSNSSGLIDSRNSKESKAIQGPNNNDSNIKILDNWEYRYFVDQQPTESVNLEEIRYYESFHYSHRKQERDFMAKNFRDQGKYTKRRMIEEQIVEEYPQFGELQLKFLSSVVFIQRKWRQFRLYKQVFKNLAQTQHKISQNSFEQSNSKQLNISFTQKSPQKSQKSSFKKDTKQDQKQSSPKREQQKEQVRSIGQSPLKKQLFKPEKEKAFREEKIPLRNNIYLDYREVGDDQSFSQSFRSGTHKMKEPQRSELVEPEENFPEHQMASPYSQNYQFLSNQLFPSVSYLQLKHQQLKTNLELKIRELQHLLRTNTITHKEYTKLKTKTQQEFKVSIAALSKSRKDLKKGYLSFIQTCRNIRQEHTGLRRVSSENGPMANLYAKVYCLDKTVKTSSQSSESMRRLSKRVLIRKEFFQTQKIEPNVFQGHQTRSAREKGKQKEFTALSARFGGRIERKQQKQQKGLSSNRIKQGLLASPEMQIYEISPEKISPSEQKGQQTLANLSQQQTQSRILQQIIAVLSHELFLELVRIDQARELAIDILNESQQFQKLRPSEMHDFELVSETDSLSCPSEEKEEKEDDFEIVEEFKFREIFKIEGLSGSDRSEVSFNNRKHRNSPHTHHISPASTEPIPFESEEILVYAKELFKFIQKQEISGELVRKLNKNQGFTPKEYLKFLRDFQIPEEQYDPLISNEVFIEWQDSYYTTRVLPAEEEGYPKRQSITIFHRCVFEAVIGLLEEQRPSGDKGEPFPWENTVYFRRDISVGSLPVLFEESVGRLSKMINARCGLIEQKQLIFGEQDMQRFHEENEDRIINMLQQELSVSPDSWYEIEEHGLEIKLQIEVEVYEYLMLEALDELLEIV